MDGPEIITRTLSLPAVPDKHGNLWQYHSRSDRHSKVACWAILFDLLQHSQTFAAHARAGKVTFGINRQMRDFRTNRTKDLDLVISRPGPAPLSRPPATMHDLALRWGLRLTPEQRTRLAELAPLVEGTAGNVLVALEAKACMTAHIKALPRLFDELSSSYSTVHADTQQALAVGFAMINAAPTFLSADMNKYDLRERNATVNIHPEHAVTRTIAKMREIDRRTGPGTDGFDAFGAMVVSMRNDGTPVTLITDPPAPRPDDVDSYQRMIGRVVQSYDVTFAGI
ncbi:hypothetical protein [Cellulomonas sp. ATA003]|uniref:hypothetical protein n=1 Tax=Cellulomonas sp. ATA003 TaxID=3073064 RepID=UPI002873B835|nr:hypothetical protein [Cellulomonas sp. ATA003]WNB86452.1 hypothetical protein REH70_04225 [Cellulomonas sp. ATA003]